MAPSTKIKVSLQVSAKRTSQTTRIDCNFNAQDTVGSFKERVTLVFEQTGLGVPAGVQADLCLDGQTLPAESRLSDCGVKEGTALDFAVQFSEATLANQCAELLRSARASVSADELGFMYAHRHCVSALDALALLGLKGTTFEAFLGEQKLFTLGGGQVSLKEPEPAPTPAGTPAGTVVEPDEELDDDLSEEEVAEAAAAAAPTDCSNIKTTITVSSEEEDSKVDVAAWKSVGQRFQNAFAQIGDDDEEEEEERLPLRAAGYAGESPLTRTVTSNEQISDIKVDVPAWRSLGERFGKVMDAFEDDEEEEDDFSSMLLAKQRQKNTNRRVSFSDVVSTKEIDIDAWKSIGTHVGGAVASAIGDAAEDESTREDVGALNPCDQKRIVTSVHEISEIEVNVPNWQSVGARVRNAFASIAAEDSDEEDFLPCRRGNHIASLGAFQEAIVAS